jgi:protein-glutamine gamma-glutamyltransferase
LKEVDFTYSPSGDRFDYDILPPNLDPGVVTLARNWVEGVPTGWPQIATIVDQLRTNYVHDPSYSPPAECIDPLSHFLLESQRGSDYQFATAAAVMLRISGYRTRLVSGFYAHPDHYDPESQHTPVVKEDLHFWAELMLPNGDWLVLEPTPGFEVAGPKLSLSEQIKAAAVSFAFWAWRNSVTLLVGMVIGIVLWIRRRELFDAVSIRCWRWFPGRTWRDQVRRVVRHLERRGRWVGTPRTPRQTVATWLKSALAVPGDTALDLNQLTHMAEWASYGPELLPPWTETESLAVCRRILDFWTVKRWRVVAFAATTNGAQSCWK